MPVQADRVELGQHEDPVQAGVDAVRDRDVDQAILAGDRDRGLAPRLGEREEAGPASPTEYQADDLGHHDSPDRRSDEWLVVSCRPGQLSRGRRGQLFPHSARGSTLNFLATDHSGTGPTTSRRAGPAKGYQPIAMLDSITFRAPFQVGPGLLHVEPDGVELVPLGLGQAVAGLGAGVDGLGQAEQVLRDDPGVPRGAMTDANHLFLGIVRVARSPGLRLVRRRTRS